MGYYEIVRSTPGGVVKKPKKPKRYKMHKLSQASDEPHPRKPQGIPKTTWA